LVRGGSRSRASFATMSSHRRASTMTIPLGHNSGKCVEVVGTARLYESGCCMLHGSNHCGVALKLNDVVRLRSVLLDKFGNKCSMDYSR
jgi:hypothetical protein